MTTVHDTVTGIVEDKFSSTMGLAQEAFATATGLINNLSSLNNVIPFSPIAPTITPIGIDAPDLEVPVYSGTEQPGSVVPEYPQLSEAAPITFSPTSADYESPALNIPSVPDYVSVADVTAPYISDVALPEVPSVDYGALPTQTTITFPDVPVIALPQSPDISIPVFTDDLVYATFDPSAVFSAVDAAMSFLNAELSGAATVLLDFMRTPQMAIGDLLTAQMITRDKLKLADEYSRRYTDTTTYYSSRGWNIPHGILIAKINELDRLYALSEDNILRDYTIKDWELSQQNWQHAVSTIPTYTNTLVQLSNSMLTTTIETAKYAFEAGYNMYKAAVEVYKQNVEVYKTQYIAYETQINAAKTLVDFYTAQLSAVKTQVDVDILQVELYKASTTLQALKIELYKASLQGVTAETEIAKLRVEVYKAEIEAFVAKLSTNNTKAQIYQAQIAGEEAKVKLAGTELANFATNAEINKSILLAQIENARFVSEKNKTNAMVYDAQVRGYAAEIEGALKSSTIAFQKYSSEVAGNEAIARIATAKAELQIKQAEVEMRAAELSFGSQVKLVDIELQAATTTAQIAAEAIKGAASVAAQLAASALSAVSAGVQLSSQVHDSVAFNHNISSTED